MPDTVPRAPPQEGLGRVALARGSQRADELFNNPIFNADVQQKCFQYEGPGVHVENARQFRTMPYYASREP